LQQDSIERIRSATFAIARKGYDKREVERFLAKLADWLESGGGDQARSDLVKRELERVGEKTARILSEAEDSAELLRNEAQQEANMVLDRAREQAARSKQSADEYAARTRHDADGYGKKVRQEAEASAVKTRDAATQEARAAIDDAQSKARRIVEEGAKRRGDIEAVISDLVRERDALLAGVEQLTSRLRSVVAEHSPTPGADAFASPKELDPAERAAAAPGRRGSAAGSERSKQKTARRRRKPGGEQVKA
jgi:DivIVA domain-containing protein